MGIDPEALRDQVWVGELNSDHAAASCFQDVHVGFYDTTLRDGEQTVGVVFDPDQKVEIARHLDALGVERIEAGFPRVSAEDLEAFHRILDADLKAEVWGFSRALKGDVDALVDLGVRHAVIEVPTSEIKLSAYGLTHEKVTQRAVDAIRYADENGISVAFFAVDGTRTEMAFLKDIYQASLEAGAQEIVVVDTIGACSPEAVEILIGKVRSWVGSDIPLHFHGHNDFGMATASAIAAVRAGARWIQGTINGMGERAGNADICEIGMALSCLYGVSVNLRFDRALKISKLVQEYGGYELDAWRPLVGRNLFVRESGAVISQFHIPEAIEPFSAEIIGASRGIALGKKSGLASIELKLKELGLELDKRRHPAVLAEVKRLSIAEKGLVSDAQFREVVATLSGAD